jgi:hypothetical protein
MRNLTLTQDQYTIYPATLLWNSLTANMPQGRLGVAEETSVQEEVDTQGMATMLRSRTLCFHHIFPFVYIHVFLLPVMCRFSGTNLMTVP